jgi:hypothetical protein
MKQHMFFCNWPALTKRIVADDFGCRYWVRVLLWSFLFVYFNLYFLQKVIICWNYDSMPLPVTNEQNAGTTASLNQIWKANVAIYLFRSKKIGFKFVWINSDGKILIFLTFSGNRILSCPSVKNVTEKKNLVSSQLLIHVFCQLIHYRWALLVRFAVISVSNDY